MLTKINFPEKLKPTECDVSDDCKFDPNLDCKQFTLPDGYFMHKYCAQNKCKKDEDCSKLNDPKLKHKPGKCEKKICNYDFFYDEDKPLVNGTANDF